MKIDNPYHNPFCDHKTHRDHTATHHIFCHKEYTPLPHYFSLFLTSPRHSRIFASDITRCWPAQAVNNPRARELLPA